MNKFNHVAHGCYGNIPSKVESRRVRLEKPDFVVVKKPNRLRTILAYGVVIVGVAVASFVVSPAKADGSMAPSVRVIVVQPSAAVRRLNAMENLRKAQKAEAKAEAKAQRAAEKAAEKARVKADKAYAKKLEAQRKARK